MKYGIVKNGKVFEKVETDESGKQLSGHFERNDKGERLTAQEMIAKHNLKPITTPNDFNGRYGDYSFVESETEIIIGALTKSARERLQAAELTALRTRRERECFSIINRGTLWYDLLTDQQKADLNIWYIEWLNVTETKQVPEIPESLAEVIK